MHDLGFIQDLTIVMIVGAIVTALFHRLKQPVVLGYILAGLLVGPNLYKYILGEDHAFKGLINKHTVETLSELGVIFLMFGLGLHFSLKDLAKVGPTAFVAACLEIGTMLVVGFGMGKMFGWTQMDCIFLGAVLAMSSTTIIIKALTELGMLKEKFSQIVFGILIVEDILGIAIIALLSGLGKTGGIELGATIQTLLQLAIFLVIVLVLGLIIVPYIIRFVDKFKSKELLVISVIALCLGVSMLAYMFEYSVALGAFLIGAIIAEVREKAKIESLILPVQDMFSAVFFVYVGTLIQPEMLFKFIGPIICITLAIVIFKVLTCTIGAFVTGNTPATSLKVGMSLAQVGEFSFIIASLGLAMGVISDFFYPIIVMVSAITTLLTPFLIKNSDSVAVGLRKISPPALDRFVRNYSSWFNSKPDNAEVSPMSIAVKRTLLRFAIQTILNIAIVTGLFILANVLANRLDPWVRENQVRGGTELVRAMIWLLATGIALPFFVVMVQKLRAVSLMLAEMWTSGSGGNNHEVSGRQTIMSYMVFFAGILVLLLWLIGVSVALMPPWPVALVALGVFAVIIAFRWKVYAGVYAKAESALKETLKENPPMPDEEKKVVLPVALNKAELASVEISKESFAAGKLIRELDLRNLAGSSVVAIERDNENIVNPGADEELLAGDKILLIGVGEQIIKGRQLLTKGV